MFWNDDIAWCGNSKECANSKYCFRHLDNRLPQPEPDIFTMAYLKDTEYCQGFKEKKEREE